MPLARATWIVVVVICAIAAVLFAIGGYTGYAITICAVGLAAAVNLLPSPTLRGRAQRARDSARAARSPAPRGSEPQRRE